MVAHTALPRVKVDKFSVVLFLEILAATAPLWVDPISSAGTTHTNELCTNHTSTLPAPIWERIF